MNFHTLIKYLYLLAVMLLIAFSFIDGYKETLMEIITENPTISYWMLTAILFVVFIDHNYIEDIKKKVDDVGAIGFELKPINLEKISEIIKKVSEPN